MFTYLVYENNSKLIIENNIFSTLPIGMLDGIDLNEFHD